MRLIFPFLLIHFFILQSFSCQHGPTSANSTPLIIDADTANEIDDLYAIVRALVAPELDIKGITSAQYHRSPLAPKSSVGESQKINEEIAKLMKKENVPLVLGANQPLADELTPQKSEAATFIIREAHKMRDGEKLQIAILGPCTNVASALLIDPKIAEKIEVSYIGFWHDQEKGIWSKVEFNSDNDQKAVNVLLNNPELTFHSMTATTSAKLVFDKENARQYLSGRGGIKDYLYDRWLNYKRWWQKEDKEKKQWTMWDVAIIEALIHPDNATSESLFGPKTNLHKKLDVYMDIDVDAMKNSFWSAIDEISDEDVDSYLIQNASVLTMKNREVIEGKDILINNGKIREIVPAGTIIPPERTTIISAKGRYVLPGLSEMHAHIPVSIEGGSENHVKETMMLYLANGVTVIRGMLGNPYHLELKKKIANGEIIAPRIYTSSPSFNGNSVGTIKEAQEKVAKAKDDGYDFLKIHPGIQLDVMEALVQTAKEKKINFSGHVPFEVGIERALSFPYASVDHVDGYIRGLISDGTSMTSEDVGFFGAGLVDNIDENKIEGLSKLTKENNVWIVPTQSLFTRWASPMPAAEMMQAKEFDYLSADTRYTWRTNKDRMLAGQEYSSDNYEKFLKLRMKIIKSLYDHDVDFLLGSDSPQVMNVPGFSIHHEISSLLDCGIPAYDLIESGTSAPARFFDDQGVYGTIELGADADLIIVEENPLENPSTLREPIGTLINGTWLDRAYFKAELEKLSSKHNE